MNPEAGQGHSSLGKRNKTYLKKLQILRLYDQPEHQTLSAIVVNARAGYKLVKETILTRDLLGKVDPTDHRIEQMRDGVQAVSEHSEMHTTLTSPSVASRPKCRPTSGSGSARSASASS